MSAVDDLKRATDLMYQHSAIYQELRRRYWRGFWAGAAFSAWVVVAIVFATRALMP